MHGNRPAGSARPPRHTAGRSCWCQPASYMLCPACDGLREDCSTCDSTGLLPAEPGDERHSLVFQDHMNPWEPRRRLSIDTLRRFEDETGEPCVAERAEVVGMIKAMIG